MLLTFFFPLKILEPQEPRQHIKRFKFMVRLCFFGVGGGAGLFWSGPRSEERARIYEHNLLTKFNQSMRVDKVDITDIKKSNININI